MSPDIRPYGAEVSINVCLHCHYATKVGAPTQQRATKPRISISELAEKRKRCLKLKQQGKECTEFSQPAVPSEEKPKQEQRWEWAYGVTTCVKRRDNLLPRTLESLSLAGFDNPRLFVDGVSGRPDWATDLAGENVTSRWPEVQAYGNWVLSMWELFLRQPKATHYVIFQDDVVAVRNLRSYLEQSDMPEDGYMNLFTFTVANEKLLTTSSTGWLEGATFATPDERKADTYHGKNQQYGKGAVALVFSKKAVVALLSSLHMVEHSLDPFNGWRGIDGSIVESMNKAGFREYIHNPSLVQHIGQETSLDRLPRVIRARRRGWLAHSFPGENFDAESLLPCNQKV